MKKNPRYPEKQSRTESQELDALLSDITPENIHSEIEFCKDCNISKTERNLREESAKFARASVALEGFSLSDEYDAETKRYIDGEIDLSGLKDYLDTNLRNRVSQKSGEGREYIEGHYASYRTIELLHDPVKGDFNVAHLKEINRRIFQDLPGFKFDDVTPGEYRSPCPLGKDWIKQRELTSIGSCSVVAYSTMDEVAQEQLESILSDVNLDKLRKMDVSEFVEEMGKLYTKLDYIHPFGDGNSRTLRVFTRQLAKEAGYVLDWSRFSEGNAGRDILYIARDLSVNEIAIQSAKNADTRREIAFSLDQFNGNRNLPVLLLDVIFKI